MSVLAYVKNVFNIISFIDYYFINYLNKLHLYLNHLLIVNQIISVHKLRNVTVCFSK